MVMNKAYPLKGGAYGGLPGNALSIRRNKNGYNNICVMKSSKSNSELDVKPVQKDISL